MHKRNFVLIIINIALLAIACIGSFIIPSKNTFSVQKSVLLNTKYRDNVNYLEFRNPQNLNPLIIRKSNDIWYGEYDLLGEGDLLVFPIDNKLITQFIDNISTIKNLYKVSESFSTFDSFGLTDNNAFNIKIGHDSVDDIMNIYSDLYFGINDFTQTNIFLRTNKKTIYKTKDDLSSYFNINPEFWVDHELFPDYLSITNNLIQKISIKYSDHTDLLEPNDDKFNTILTRFLGLRGASINCNSVLEDNQNIKLFCEITLEDSLTEYGMNIYSTENENQFYYLPDSITNIPFNYVLELSSYTIGRININSN